jgi:DNA repair protein RadC
MKPIGINVVDHIIVAGDHYVSFAEQGLMDSLLP